MPSNQFKFGRQTITTKVNIMVPRAARAPLLDILVAMEEEPRGRSVALPVLGSRSNDPFADVVMEFA